jgi:hypothetical protein
MYYVVKFAVLCRQSLGNRHMNFSEFHSRYVQIVTSVAQLARKLWEALQVTLLSSVAKQPKLGLGGLVFEVSSSHTDTHGKTPLNE